MTDDRPPIPPPVPVAPFVKALSVVLLVCLTIATALLVWDHDWWRLIWPVSTFVWFLLWVGRVRHEHVLLGYLENSYRREEDLREYLTRSWERESEMSARLSAELRKP